ncbi:MAG: cell division protein FtsQ [Betaproteobacteria bacterium]|nr:cell division protein FtsQ [Betaproteobacteria bacterium]
MWDKPAVLNGIANVLFAAAFVLIAYATMHFGMRLPIFPLREVRITEPLAHVTPQQIEAIVGREVKGNFLTLDLERARAGFEKLPWVRGVNVRRQWPDRLDVSLEEHLPLGRWGAGALVNTYGELFAAAYDASLPLFVGPPGSETEIAIQYGYFKRSLAPLNLAPVEVQVSARRAWQVKLANGTRLQLGREQVEPRLDRFVAVYERTVGRLQRRLDYVDLRYSNGFAVGIPELAREPSAKPIARKNTRSTG